MKTRPNAERRKKNPAGGPRLTAPVSPARGPFPVIAMATSVGGLKALSVILGGLPADFPAAVAIVMHVSADHKSILAEILGRRTPLKVREAKTGDFLCLSCVFVAPPNHHLFVAPDGRLKLSSSSALKFHYARPSAEPLFASVAKVFKKKAIAVVLTGGDGDGSFGVQIIKDQGGLVIAQDRPTSENFSMPESSIQTGDVDFILPWDEIGRRWNELMGAGPGQKPGRTTAPQNVPTPARSKCVTPHYPARTKAAMVSRWNDAHNREILTAMPTEQAGQRFVAHHSYRCLRREIRGLGAFLNSCAEEQRQVFCHRPTSGSDAPFG